MRKNWLIYGIVVIILFAFIYVRDSAMTYTAFYAALILPIFSYGLALVSKKKIVFVETLGTSFLAKNEQTEYKVEIHNRGFLPCFFAKINFDLQHMGLDSDSGVMYFSLGARERSTLTTKISGQYRGLYEVGVGEIVIYDFLGLFKVRPHYSSQVRLTIMPRIVQMNELHIDANDDGETTTKRHLPGADLSIATDLREYLPTDSSRQIHWKATAKKGELISKNPQEIEQPQAVFFVDNRRIQKSLMRMLEQEDKLIDAVVSVMSHCYNAGHRISLQTLQAKFLRNKLTTEREFTSDFTRLYQEVAALPFGEFGDLTQLLSDYYRFGNNFDNLYLFTQDIDAEAALLIQEIRGAGSQVTLFLYGQVTDGMRRKLESIGVECFIKY